MKFTTKRFKIHSHLRTKCVFLKNTDLYSQASKDPKLKVANM